jgi:hypothetical protein
VSQDCWIRPSRDDYLQPTGPEESLFGFNSDFQKSITRQNQIYEWQYCMERPSLSPFIEINGRSELFMSHVSLIYFGAAGRGKNLNCYIFWYIVYVAD